MTTTYTVEEMAANMRVSVATIRRHAESLGGYKPPGFRRWLFRVNSAVWESSNEQQGAGRLT